MVLNFADAFEMTDDREGEDGDRRRTSDTPGMGTVYRHVQVAHPTNSSIRTSSLLLFYTSLFVDMVICHPHGKKVCLL